MLQFDRWIRLQRAQAAVRRVASVY
jgi:hypothetical protein